MERVTSFPTVDQHLAGVVAGGESARCAWGDVSAAVQWQPHRGNEVAVRIDLDLSPVDQCPGGSVSTSVFLNEEMESMRVDRSFARAEYVVSQLNVASQFPEYRRAAHLRAVRAATGGEFDEIRLHGRDDSFVYWLAFSMLKPLRSKLS